MVKRKQPFQKVRACEVCLAEHNIAFCKECGIVHKRICHNCFIAKQYKAKYKEPICCPECEVIHNAKIVHECKRCYKCALHCRCYE